LPGSRMSSDVPIDNTVYTTQRSSDGRHWTTYDTGNNQDYGMSYSKLFSVRGRLWRVNSQMREVAYLQEAP
jgi:hypothetical protein